MQTIPTVEEFNIVLLTWYYNFVVIFQFGNALPVMSNG